MPGILANGYFAAIPGGTLSGCNPITTAGIECVSEDIEKQAALVVPGWGSWVRSWRRWRGWW